MHWAQRPNTYVVNAESMLIEAVSFSFGSAAHNLWLELGLPSQILSNCSVNPSTMYKSSSVYVLTIKVSIKACRSALERGKAANGLWEILPFNSFPVPLKKYYLILFKGGFV